jgi:hypothetical protein
MAWVTHSGRSPCCGAWRWVLPLAAGLLFHGLSPAFSERLSPILGKAASVLLLIAAIPVLMAIWPAMAALAGNGTLLAMALLAVIALTGGHLLGGPAREHRAALAMAAATRHPGIALMIAGAAQADRRVTAAILAVALVGTLVTAPYQFWVRRRRPPLSPERRDSMSRTRRRSGGGRPLHPPAWRREGRSRAGGIGASKRQCFRLGVPRITNAQETKPSR